jgi:thiamine monophosphate synthase
VGLNAAFAEICRAAHCPFFAAEEVTTASKVDGVHLDEDQHATLGAALVPVVAGIFDGRP